MKLVSVIVPVYNVEHYLGSCIKSILAQTYTNIEVILVDDGATDDSPALCDALSTEHANVRVIHKDNGGLASARLAGFEVCLGEYILFVDSDDLIKPEMVEKLVSAMERDGSQLGLCAYAQLRDSGTVEKPLPYMGDTIRGRQAVIEQYVLPLIGPLSNGINIPGFLCTRLHRRSLIQSTFFGSERIYFKEDHYFDLLYADAVNTISVVNEPLYVYRYNAASLTNSYRMNKWWMYENLYEFNKEYLDQRGLLAPERMDGFLASALFSVVDNAVALGSYAAFSKELEIILARKLAQRALQAGVESSRGTTKFTMRLLGGGHMRLLYAIRKSRLGE